MRRAILGVVGLLILLSGSCTKNPTGPTSAQGPFLYALSEQYGDGYCRIFYVDTSVDSLVDSLLLPYAPLGLGASPSGDRLYLAIGSGNFIEVNPHTKQVVYQGQNSGVPTPDGKYLLDVIYPDPFRVIDTRTHRELFASDTSFDGITISFDEKRSLVYGPINNRTQIGIFNYRKLRWEKIINPADIGGALPVLNVALAPLLQKLYYTSPTYNPWFCVLDLQRDTVVNRLSINSGGYLAISNDNRYVYITDPGGYLFEPVTTGYVGVYSTLDEAPAPSLDTRVADDSSCENFLGGGLPTDQIAITPDGRKIYASVFFDCLMVVIDLPSNGLRGIDLGGTTLIRQLLIQP